MVNYFIRLIKLRATALPWRKVLILERKLLKDVNKMESREIALFNIAFVSDKGAACTYVAANTKDETLYEYAILKANLLYYNDMTLH